MGDHGPGPQAPTLADGIGFAEGQRVIHLDSARVLTAVRVLLEHPDITRVPFGIRTNIRGGSVARYHTTAQALAAELADCDTINDQDVVDAVTRAASARRVFSRPAKCEPLEVAVAAA